ncbi:competence type IV pilus minor pilin ComGF [Actinomycetes bacterium NPDC127524]
MILRKDDGFTMAEMLASLVVLLSISSLVLQMAAILHTSLGARSSINPREWEICINQIKREVRQSTSQEASGDTVYLVVGSDVVTIEKYQDKLRRKLNGAGYEVLLQNIKSFYAKKEGKSIVLTVTDKEGASFSRILRPYITSRNE